MDTVKVSMQCAGENKVRGSSGKSKGIVATATSIIKNDGVSALYKGLGSALLRQVTYGTIRIGVYRYLSDQETKVNKTVSFNKKLMYSIFSGAAGSLFGNPFDVVLVRMQSDNTLPVD